MIKGKSATEEILKASYRLELFVRKVESATQKAVTYNPDANISNDIAMLSDFVESQKQIIVGTRNALLTGSQVWGDDYLGRDIKSTPLSTRIVLALRGADINTVRELLVYKDTYGLDRLLRLRNLGTKSFDELVNFINAVETL